MNFNLIRLSAVTFACWAAVSANAQIKTDGEWRGTGGAAFSVTSGNTSNTALLVNGDGYRATADDKMTAGGFINYARTKVGASTLKTSEKWYGFGQYDRNLTDKLFAFGRGSLEGDGLIDLTYRLTLAGGVGYKVIAMPDTSFTVYAGLAHGIDKYGSVQSIGGKIDDGFSRTSLYLAEDSSHKLSDTVSFKQRFELYPGLTGDKAKIAKFTAGLTVAMSSTLGINLGVIDSYNSKPPLGAKKNDLAVFTGVNVKFGAN